MNVEKMIKFLLEKMLSSLGDRKISKVYYKVNSIEI